MRTSEEAGIHDMLAVIGIPMRPKGLSPTDKAMEYCSEQSAAS